MLTSILMYFIYNNNLQGYASPIKSMESAFQTILGKFDAKQCLYGTSTILGPCVFASYNIVMLTFVLNIFVSIITDSFDKIRHECKDHPEKYDVDIFKYLKEKWSRERGGGMKNVFGAKKTKITYENYVDHLSSFHIQIKRLIVFLAAVILFLFFISPII